MSVSSVFRRVLRRFGYPTLVALLVLVVAVPAVGSHIQEPTNPITGVNLTLAEYSSGTLIECGSVVSGINNLRIESRVEFDGAPPSEHWTTRLTMKSAANRGANWYALWHHQNVAPHSQPQLVQAQQALLPGSDYTVVLLVVGDESGNRFEESCSFSTS